MTLTNYNIGDIAYTFSGGVSGTMTPYQSSSIARLSGFGYNGNWNAVGDPTLATVGEGFWYFNSGATVNWVENFSVNGP